MSDTYIDFRKKENILPLELPNKSKFYTDIMNIEHSFSGRIGTVINTFVMEAAQQLINAIELFELGYFDCAYYSLRSAVDVSTTMVFLTDMPNKEQQKYLDDWKDTKHFPMQGQILQMLAVDGNIFVDMKENMPSFFSDAKQLCKELNKYVHKQGLDHFYISRSHPLNANRPQDKYVSDFEHYLKKCIGVVAVMRLAADPFPVLLMDGEILLRCFDSMTEPYSQDFVNEYIGEQTINEYKQTLFYQCTYDSFIDDEKKNLATFDVLKHQYIDRNRMSDILKQLHLLDVYDSICVLIVNACEKITKMYTMGGFQMYFTEKKTNRTAHSYKGLDFKVFSENDNKYNQPYDEAYISVFHFLGEDYYAEHNDLLNEDEIIKINSVLEKFEDDQKENKDFEISG